MLLVLTTFYLYRTSFGRACRRWLLCTLFVLWKDGRYNGYWICHINTNYVYVQVCLCLTNRDVNETNGGFRWDANPNYSTAVYSFLIQYAIETVAQLISFRLEYAWGIPVIVVCIRNPLECVGWLIFVFFAN